MLELGGSGVQFLLQILDLQRTPLIFLPVFLDELVELVVLSLPVAAGLVQLPRIMAVV